MKLDKILYCFMFTTTPYLGDVKYKVVSVPVSFILDNPLWIDSISSNGVQYSGYNVMEAMMMATDKCGGQL